MHFRVLGQSMVVLGSADAIFEYLDKRSANTSDRIQTPMIELYVLFFPGTRIMESRSSRRDSDDLHI